MATTLSNGVVIPDPADLIPGNGVQAFRDQGASVNSALGNRALVGHTHTWGQIEGKPSFFPPAPHTHVTGDVDGLDEALEGKVDDDDPRLADARTPLPHEHPISDVDGLSDRLVTAEDLIAAHEQRLDDVDARTTAVEAQSDATATTVDQIKLANQSAGEGAPTGTAPIGWIYTDIATGDIYRMEA